MALNILDGIISPLSNITEARFGIAWGVRVELETEGIVDFPVTFPGRQVIFEVTSDLPTPGTFLYGIVFVDGVVGSELRNFAPFTIFENFTMAGAYDATTKTYSFQEPGGTVRTSGDKLWLTVRVSSGQFPSVSDIDVFDRVQHPFQFTLAGATNGHQKTTHLFSTAKKGLTLKMPFFKRTGTRISEVNTVESGWAPVGTTGGEGIIGRRVSDTIRSSQPFEMLSKWAGAAPLAGTVTTQTDTPESLLTWVILEDVFQTEHPQCDQGVQPPFVQPSGSQTAPITYGDAAPPTDSGDGLRVTFAATPASQTIHRVQTLLSSDTEGSGTAACDAGASPPDGDILATDAYRARNRDAVPPDFSTWGFDRWLEQ